MSERDERAVLCEWCGDEVRQPGTGRRRLYCRASCRQRAYEERQVQERLQAARLASAAEGAASTYRGMRSGTDPQDLSRDETRSPAHRPSRRPLRLPRGDSS